GLLQPPEDLREAMEEARQRRQNVAEFRTSKLARKSAGRCRLPPPTYSANSANLPPSGGHERLAAAIRCPRLPASLQPRQRLRAQPRQSGAALRADPAAAGAGSLARRLWMGPEAIREDRDAAIERGDCRSRRPLRRSAADRSAACSLSLVAFGAANGPDAAHALLVPDEFWQLRGCGRCTRGASALLFQAACSWPERGQAGGRGEAAAAAAGLLAAVAIATCTASAGEWPWLLTTSGRPVLLPVAEGAESKAQWKFALGAFAAACELRPTSAVPCVMLCLFFTWHRGRSRRRLGRCWRSMAPLACSVLAEYRHPGPRTCRVYCTPAIRAGGIGGVKTALTLLVDLTLYVLQLPGPQGVPLRCPAVPLILHHCGPCLSELAPPLPQSRCRLALLAGRIPAAFRGASRTLNHLRKRRSCASPGPASPRHLDPDLHFLFMAPCHSLRLIPISIANVSATRTLDCSPNWRDQPGYVEGRRPSQRPRRLASRLTGHRAGGRRHPVLFDSFLQHLRGPEDGKCPAGWINRRTATFCYQMSDSEANYRTWADAKKACELQHASLLSNYVAGIINAYGSSGDKKYWWFGLTRSSMESLWQWDDGHTVTSSPGKSGRENFAEISITGGVSGCDARKLHVNLEYTRSSYIREEVTTCDTDNGWMYQNNRCYKVHNFKTGEEGQNCETARTGYPQKQGYHRTVIHRKDDVATRTSRTSPSSRTRTPTRRCTMSSAKSEGTSANFWIGGLRTYADSDDPNRLTPWRWVDDSSLNLRDLEHRVPAQHHPTSIDKDVRRADSQDRRHPHPWQAQTCTEVRSGFVVASDSVAAARGAESTSRTSINKYKIDFQNQGVEFIWIGMTPQQTKTNCAWTRRAERYTSTFKRWRDGAAGPAAGQGPNANSDRGGGRPARPAKWQAATRVEMGGFVSNSLGKCRRVARLSRVRRMCLVVTGL
uniref:C-type lectin domain-containing protein n=1 Tax=Macrostomum lignano TaxID=282301 RepID=A0A1I8FAY6_9PLAT